MGLESAHLMEFRRIANPRGNLTPIEGEGDVPFDIKRVYYLYDVPGGEVRGGHAHRHIEQVIIAASGSFDVVLDDGVKRARFMLNRSYYGLYVPTMVWRELENFCRARSASCWPRITTTRPTTSATSTSSGKRSEDPCERRSVWGRGRANRNAGPVPRRRGGHSRAS